MKAILIGATGLVGKEILRLLLASSEFSTVEAFVRRKTGISHPKLTEHLVDFDRMEQWRELLQGDVLFCALGTTSKAAGSKEAQYKVDFTYQLEVARSARAQGVPSLVLVSSTGADAASPFFYLRMKGALERALEGLRFENLTILRPGPLAGEREKPRSGEKLSQFFLGKLPPLRVLATLLPVEARAVARKAVEGSLVTKGVSILEARDIRF